MVRIVSRWDSAVVLHTSELSTVREAVLEAIAKKIDLSGADLRSADLTDADLTGADLTGADLTGADLTGADLTGADLTGANLSGAYLSGAYLSGADPVVPSLHRQTLAAIDAGGALDMGDWHTCETTHCRAGWAVHLAGEEGKKLEKAVGTNAAAAIIIQASCPWMERVPSFYATDAAALEDIKACAEKEAPL